MNRGKLQTRLSVCRESICGMVERGWSQEEVAEVMGVPRKTLVEWMKRNGVEAARKCRSRGERFIRALEERKNWGEALAEGNMDRGYGERLYKLWEKELEENEGRDRLSDKEVEELICRG